MQIWMLTGDKLETTKCIAISTGLKSHKESIFEMRELSNSIDITEAIQRYSQLINSHMLMVDGNTLEAITENDHLKERFFTTVQKAKSVCICRCSPT